MVNHQTLRRSQGRKIIAAAALSLLVLRGLSLLAFAGPLAELSNFVDPVLSAFFLEEHCDRADGETDRKAPLQDCADCCVLCASAAPDLAVPVASNSKGTISLLTRAKISPSKLDPDELRAPRPPGLIANWSATSPPRNS
ncbi:MAG: hypothetical protein AB7F41_09745 [Methylocystis sp.]|uniref:hypothetical protein n=1 Tax=Methylocystis sp. TaxID=1911079 RepID=UPI003D0B97A3